MKTLVTVLVTSLSVFALATAWVDYVQPRLQIAAQTASEPESEDLPRPARKRPRRLPVEVAEDTEPLEGADVERVKTPAPAALPKSSIRETLDAETEQLLAQKLDEVRQQESNLAARQDALRMIYADIQTELSAVEEIRRKTSDDLATAERRMAEIAQRRAAAAKPTRTASTRTTTEQPQLSQDARLIFNLIQEGKTETAVSLLKARKSADAAGILHSLGTIDDRIAEQLTERLIETRGTVRR